MTSTAVRHPAPPAKFLPGDLSIRTFADVESFLLALAERELDSVEALQEWLLDRSELASALAEESLTRSYASQCHTNDDELEKAHLAFQTELLPAVKPLEDRLDRIYLACPFRKDLGAEWEVYDREVDLAARLYRQENVALEAQEEELINQYDRLIGAMTVEFRGETRTLSAMRPFLEDPDRATREESWRVSAARRLQDADALDDLFAQMRENRIAQAKNANYENFRDYMHDAKERFDYTPADCIAFADNVASMVMPVMERLQAHRQQALGLEQLRPWDMGVDLEGAPAFEPFQDPAGQVDVSARLLEAIEPNFGEELRWMDSAGLLDLDTRPHKAPGGFMDTYERRRVPTIFANSGTTHSDIETLVHEGGHALNGLFARHLEPVSYRMPPLEFAEVASMGMESMAMEHFAKVYPQEDARRARLQSLEGMITTFAWVAVIDGFQQWLYTDGAEADAQERRAYWCSLHDRFAGKVDWSGLQAERDSLWQRQLHIYHVPFYYIEYAQAQMGALQLWIRYRKEPEAAVADYRHALSLGGSRKLPELFEAAGLVYDPRGEGLGEWMEEVEREWKKALPA